MQLGIECSVLCLTRLQSFKFSSRILVFLLSKYLLYRYEFCTVWKLMMMSSCLVASFSSVVLQFGILCCLIWTIYTQWRPGILYHVTTSWNTVNCLPVLWSLDHNVRDLVSQLRLTSPRLSSRIQLPSTPTG